MNFRNWRSLLVALLFPVLVAAISIWSLSGQSSRISEVPAAIVNLDEGATMNLGGKEQFVPAGRLIVAELMHPTNQNRVFGWKILPQEKATEGLRNGSLEAIVTIPKDFSRNLSKLGTPQSVPAMITVTTNGASDSLTSRLSDQITAAAAHVSGVGSTKQLLEGIFLNFSTLKDALGSAASGAGKLADGIGKLGDGSKQLVTGIDQLADGSIRLSDGTNQLAAGIDRLSGGLNQLSGGLTQIRNQIANVKLTDQEKADLRQAAELIKQLPPLGTALKPLLEALNNQELLDEIHQFASTCDSMPGLTQLCAQMKTLDSALQGLSAADIQQGIDALNRLESQLDKIDQNQLADLIDQAANGPDALLNALEGKAGQAGLLTGAQSLENGINQLQNGSHQLRDGMRALRDGLVRLQGGASELPGGISQLQAGATKLSDGLKQGASQIPGYTDSAARHIAEVGAEPIRSQMTQINQNYSGAAPTFPLVTALALWLGAMAVFFVIPAISQRRMESPISSIRVVWESLWRAAVVSMVAGLGILAVAAAFGLRPESFFATFTLVIGGSIVFCAVLQALMAVFGAKTGRIAALFFLVIEAALLSGILPLNTAPAALQALGEFMPLSVISNGLTTSLLVGGGQAVLGSWMILLIWLAVSVIASVAVVSRYRKLTAAQVARLDQARPTSDEAV